jgi:transcriptional regulator with XRE-family HTH domain
MVTDQQVKRLWRLRQEKLSLEVAAAKAGMDAKTARKYLRDRRLPSEMKQKHLWRTRADPFEELWPELRERLTLEPGLQAKTLFEYLQRTFPGRFSDGQLRTLQRRIKHWRATEGPAREVFFAQEHQPGQLCESDFTHCRELGVTIGGQPFPHLLYHFVLTYSNWETGTICYSESFESLSETLWGS